jgi:hypothetical protein
MICPICHDNFSNLRLHFSITDCKLHKQFLEYDIQKAKKFIESFFNLDLSISKINYKMRRQESVCACNFKFIKNTIHLSKRD